MNVSIHERRGPPGTEGPPFLVRLRPVLDLSPDQFFELCQINRDLRIERNAEGELLIMPPVGGETGGRNAAITAQLWLWARADGSGIAFDSSTGFTLPNGAVRSPDAAWIARARWERLPLRERAKFAPLCPDFVLELCSPSDRLLDIQDKLEEFIDNGARLGWLLDPEQRQVYVYRPSASVIRLDAPEAIAGDQELPGFVLDLREIW